MVIDLPVNSIAVAIVVPSMLRKQLVAELSERLVRQLKLSELEIVVQMVQFAEAVVVLYLRQLYVVGWSHGSSAEFVLERFQRHATVAVDF